MSLLYVCCCPGHDGLRRETDATAAGRCNSSKRVLSGRNNWDGYTTGPSETRPPNPQWGLLGLVVCVVVFPVVRVDHISLPSPAKCLLILLISLGIKVLRLAASG